LELAAIVALTLVIAIPVHFRQLISRSWLISIWAPHNVSSAAALIAILTFALGIALAVWKRKQLFVYGAWEVVFGT
jgi:hypothetical protein